MNIKAQELEAGLWVGQSASNVRELFQTARELVPSYIYLAELLYVNYERDKFLYLSMFVSFSESLHVISRHL